MGKVIAIDPDRNSLEYLRGLLSKNNNVEIVDVFSRRNDFLARIKETNFDLAFIRVGFKGLNGMALAREVREIKWNIKVVLVADSDYYAVDAFDADVSDYLLIPVTRERLQKTLRNVM